MVEFTLGVFAGIFLLPWYILAIIAVVILVDVGCSSHDSFVEATWAVVVGTLLVSGIGWWTGGFNPAVWVWNNPHVVLTGFGAYATIGCLWCIAKWWLFLKKVHKRSEEAHEKEVERWEKSSISQPAPTRSRPRESYPGENKGRLTGWIFHWPFSMLSVIVGDVIVRFAENLQEALQGLFERMASSRFSDYEDR
jgi:hypothetical protein